METWRPSGRSRLFANDLTFVGDTSIHRGPYNSMMWRGQSFETCPFQLEADGRTWVGQDFAYDRFLALGAEKDPAFSEPEKSTAARPLRLLTYRPKGFQIDAHFEPDKRLNQLWVTITDDKPGQVRIVFPKGNVELPCPLQTLVDVLGSPMEVRKGSPW